MTPAPQSASPRLSLLIPTLTTRREKLSRLMDVLLPQVEKAQGQIEIVLLEDDGQRTTGCKRNLLLDAAEGDYVAFIDDDDLVAPDYGARILEVLNTSGGDAVGFILEYHLGKQHPRRLGFTDKLPAKVGGYQLRAINHLCPTRLSIARQIRYPDRSQGEDLDYARRLKTSGLLQQVAFLGDPPLYQYLYDPGKPRATRPPLDALASWRPAPVGRITWQAPTHVIAGAEVAINTTPGDVQGD